MLKDPFVIRELAGLFLLVSGIAALLWAIIWLFSIDQPVGAVGLLGLLAIQGGWHLVRHEVEPPVPIEDVQK
jgi:hypothetical protein